MLMPFHATVSQIGFMNRKLYCVQKNDVDEKKFQNLNNGISG